MTSAARIEKTGAFTNLCVHHMTDSYLSATQQYDTQMLDDHIHQRLSSDRWITVGVAAQNIGVASTGDLSSQAIGGYNDVYFVIYAPGNRLKNSIPADFDWFENDPGKP